MKDWFIGWVIGWATPLVIRHLLVKEGDLTPEQAALLEPDVLRLIGDVKKLVKKYREMGMSDKGAVKAAAEQIVTPREKWTKQEERAWFDRDKVTAG